ncbi:GNAT family N-acetyltransferase [Micrococcales bacterium 31B]|nr:GNAT family N-acetyltransferase [Micrococcales bacterium 31B]
MFAADEVGSLLNVFDDVMSGSLEGHSWWVSARPEGNVVAAAYVAPEPFADRVWNLYFIAVEPREHGSGVGTGLIGHIEEGLRKVGEENARVLIVETSSLPHFRTARAFYAARGFDEEARIRDYYGPGDDKVVFWKSLVD